MLFLPRAFHARNLFVRHFTPVVLLLMLAQAAHANTFNVNSTADILNPPAGVVTLRSAIQAANSISGGNTINLTVAGVYKITLPGANTGSNATGAFVILPGGGNLTIVNTSGGLVVVDGNKLDRVFDINPAASASTAFTVMMNGFTITNGLAQPGDTALGSGGAVRSQSVASVTLDNMIVTGNEATADGGGIAMENVVVATWTLTINNTTISNNHAGDAGGGIDTDGGGTIEINSGSVISGNTALNQGGGISLDFLSIGTVLLSANLTIQNAVVSGNKTLASGATGAGGGIANTGNGAVLITSSLIESNSAASGGGFADVNFQGTLTVSSSTFLNNTAVGNGGAISEGGPSISIKSSEIDGNSSGGLGGGIFAPGTTLTVQNSTVASNTAAGNGGGIELQTSGTGSSASSITNSTLTNNSGLNNSGSNGGGIDASGNFTGSLGLTGVTISGNSADNGGGVFWTGTTGTMTFVDTIVAKNSGFSVGPDVNNPAGTFTDGGGNLIGVAGAGSGNTGFTATTTLTGTVASPLDPVFGPLQNNGGPTQTLALLPGSPAIDRGIASTSLTTDQRGVPRPQGVKFDIGAFEANQGPTPSADISTLSLDFGSEGMGSSSSQELTISDNGTAALKLSNVAISGPDAGDFKFTPPSACATLPATLQPGNFCIYTITFGPLAAGTRTAAFTFTDNHLNAPNSPQTVALSGAGIIKANTTVSLALAPPLPNPSIFGASLTFVATVTPKTATGSVTFFDGATNIGTVFLSSGTALFTTSSLAVGSHSLTAKYSGDTFNNSATSAVLAHQVLAVTSTSLAASVNPSVFGQAVTFTATVTSATPGTISGTVTFKDGATTLGSSIISSGKATLITSALAGGVHSITAVYSGNATFGPSTSTALSHTVNKAASATSPVSSSHNPSVSGQSVTFTVTVTPVAPATVTPTGTVTFKNGATVLGSGTLVSGKATFATSALTAGAHSITATYNGSVNYNTSTSSVLTQTVNKAATSTALKSGMNPSMAGLPVPFSVTVAAIAPGSGTPTGSVTLKDGTTALQTLSLSGGAASFNISSLSHGTHSITAVYSGSANDLGSTSAVLTQTVN